MKKYITLLLIPILLFACSEEPDPVFEYNKKSAKVIETNNNFGLELFRSVNSDEDRPNIMISPTSVSLALGMTYNGAETSTREAFEEVLNYGDLTREEVNEIVKELIHVLVTNSDGNLVEIANSLWYREQFPVNQGFIDLNSTYYDAEVQELDFSDPGAVDIINNWVSDKTHKKIEEIIDQISPETMMILINALYFNCLWETEFDKDDTKETDFYKENGEVFGKVDMMSVKSEFRNAWTNDFKAIELPYKNGKFSMFIFLPDNGNSVDDLIEMLDGETWNSWMEEFGSKQEITVGLPKFEFDFDRSLKEDLIAMGLEPAFLSSADFSGISPIDLLISDVIHKTYIKVNEKGTEAAAVTAVIMELTSIGNSIYFDRPFMFAITENSSNSIMFIGKVTEPEY